MNLNQLFENLRTDNPCWKGYHPVGTKKKNGRTVPNCVPNANESVENPYGYEVGQQVELSNGQQGRVLDIFDDSIEVQTPDGRTVVVDFRDAQVLDEGSLSDMVRFVLNSERAYQAVMSRFGDLVQWDDNDYMMVPEKLWPKVEQVAYDADGIGAENVDDSGAENPEHYGINEVSLGDYRKKAAMQKAQSQMGAMFGGSAEQRAKDLATFHKRERGLNRVKARDERARKAEQEKQLADTIAKLPELKAEYERMRAEYKSLGGSDWQYADREQNLTDYERKARSMEGPMNNLWRQIQAAEKAQKSQGVAEGYDKWGWHTSVTNGEFMPTKYGNKAYVYLHDMDNQSANGNPQLVTFNKPAHAKKAADQFGGKVVKTDLNTYRVVKPAEQGVAEGSFHNPGQEDSPVAQAIIRRILMQRTDLLAKYGPEYVGQAVDDVAEMVGDVDEIGSSDVSGWVRMVEQFLRDRINQYDEPMSDIDRL